jgi:hypothetical protein
MYLTEDTVNAMSKAQTIELVKRERSKSKELVRTIRKREARLRINLELLETTLSNSTDAIRIQSTSDASTCGDALNILGNHVNNKFGEGSVESLVVLEQIQRLLDPTKRSCNEASIRFALSILPRVDKSFFDRLSKNLGLPSRRWTQELKRRRVEEASRTQYLF